MKINSETEKQFEEYRSGLIEEANILAGSIALYRKLHERRKDRVREMNIAPAFFQFVTFALLSTIILWTDKIFDKKGERGIFNFLTFIENNRDILAIEQLQRRKNYPDGHWMLKREPITFKTITEDRKHIQDLLCIESVNKYRDKYFGHLDKKYFNNFGQLIDEAPLTWGDFTKVVEVLSEIIDRYSVAYDGQSFVLEPINVNDLDHLLDRLHKCDNE
jgi:hypothetical protein